MSDRLAVALTPGTETREWCNKCLLPSVVIIPLHALDVSGVYHLGTYRRCQDCKETA